MNSLKDLVERFKHGPTDVVGIDVGATATKVARLTLNGQDVTVTAADILPPCLLPSGADSAVRVEPLHLPAPVRARYASLAINHPSAVVKLFGFSRRGDEQDDTRIVASIGLADPDAFRIGYKVVEEATRGGEARILAAAVPEQIAQSAVALLPSGLPAPFSVELSDLAAMTAFLHGPGAEGDAVGVIVFGTQVSAFGLFNGGVAALVRRIDFGTNHILGLVRKSFGLDAETAIGVLADGSFDIGEAVGSALTPFVKQLIVSRDFVERRENCRIQTIHLSGAFATSREMQGAIAGALDVQTPVLDPLAGLKVGDGAVPERLVGQEWRLAAAVGACLSTFEEP